MLPDTQYRRIRASGIFGVDDTDDVDVAVSDNWEAEIYDRDDDGHLVLAVDDRDRMGSPFIVTALWPAHDPQEDALLNVATARMRVVNRPPGELELIEVLD